MFRVRASGFEACRRRILLQSRYTLSTALVEPLYSLNPALFDDACALFPTFFMKLDTKSRGLIRVITYYLVLSVKLDPKIKGVEGS